MAGNRGRFVDRLWRDLESWGDPVSRDLGAAGELFVARIRLVLVALLGLIPLKSVVLEPRQADNWIGLASVVVALAFALLFLRLAARADPPTWLGFATSQFDVLVISLGSLGFVLAGDPVTATNSLVHYTIYFIALAGTCLRHDPRVCLAAGAAALVEHGAIVLWVGLCVPAEKLHAPLYGQFGWDNQIGRLQLLVIATGLNAAIVVRSRRFWMDSMRDRLTGLLNRAFFEESFTRLAALAGRSTTRFAVAIVDLDHFKSINDRLGHAEGDEALRRAAVRMQQAFRGKDVVARIGGEEFGALLIGVDRRTAAARLDAWRAALHADAREPRLSASVGVAAFPEDGATPEALMAAADRRLYAAKRAGRNRLVAEDAPAAAPE